LLGNTHKNTEITFDLKQIDTGAKLNRGTPLQGAEASDDAGVMVHEGTHGADQFPKGHNAETKAEARATERHAYRNESDVFELLGVKSMVAPGLWDPGWPAGQAEALRSQGIEKGTQSSLDAEGW